MDYNAFLKNKDVVDKSTGFCPGTLNPMLFDFQVTGDPEASISAQLRHLRKHRFGGHDVQKRRRNDGAQWEYRLNGKEAKHDHARPSIS